MSFVAILGAGELGGALAHTLARRDRLAEVRLIDPAAGVAGGKALDIQQASPIEGFRTRLDSSGEYAAAAGAAVVVLADPVSGPLTLALSPVPGERERVESGSGPAGDQKRLEADLAVLRQVTAINLAGRAIVVCAAAAHRELVERGVRELKIDRRRLIGSAPGALESALRAMVALEAHASPGDVSLSLVGISPAQFVVPWSDASIGGARLTAVLTPGALARLNARLPRLWPPGPYALAAAAARVVEAIAGGSDRRFACFVTLDGELGLRMRAAAAPVTVGPAGVRQVLAPTLSAHERVLLDNALASVAD